MKTAILLLAMLAVAISADAQTIKELLYSGKLKSDTGTTIRKGDDLSTKIDTTTRKPVVVPEPEKPRLVSVKDSVLAARDSSLPPMTVREEAAAVSAIAKKDNNILWKDYIDSLTGSLRAEVLPSKKIKSGTYSVLIEYEIGLDGQVTANSVSSSPESSFLDQQIKERITLTAPQLTPLLNANGKPRKAVKKQMLTLAK